MTSRDKTGHTAETVLEPRTGSSDVQWAAQCWSGCCCCGVPMMAAGLMMVLMVAVYVLEVAVVVLSVLDGAGSQLLSDCRTRVRCTSATGKVRQAVQCDRDQE